jgi:hypothetical protein
MAEKKKGSRLKEASRESPSASSRVASAAFRPEGDFPRLGKAFGDSPRAFSKLKKAFLEPPRSFWRVWKAPGEYPRASCSLLHRGDVAGDLGALARASVAEAAEV